MSVELYYASEVQVPARPTSLKVPCQLQKRGAAIRKLSHAQLLRQDCTKTRPDVGSRLTAIVILERSGSHYQESGEFTKTCLTTKVETLNLATQCGSLGSTTKPLAALFQSCQRRSA